MTRSFQKKLGNPTRGGARGVGGGCTGDAAGDCRWNWSRNPLSESRRIAVSVDARTGIVGETDREIYDRDDPRERDYNLGVVCGGWGGEGGREGRVAGGGEGDRGARGTKSKDRRRSRTTRSLSLSLSLSRSPDSIHSPPRGGREGGDHRSKGGVGRSPRIRRVREFRHVAAIARSSGRA